MIHCNEGFVLKEMRILEGFIRRLGHVMGNSSIINSELEQLVGLFTESDDDGDDDDNDENMEESKEDGAAGQLLLKADNRMEIDSNQKCSDVNRTKQKTTLDSNLSSIIDTKKAMEFHAARMHPITDAVSKAKHLEAPFRHSCQLPSTISNPTKCIITDPVQKRMEKMKEERNELQRKAGQITQAVEVSMKSNYTVFDPFFGIRVSNPKLSLSAFEKYCDGLKKTCMEQVKYVAKEGISWVILAVIVDKTACLKSVKGNEYMVWKISDLKNPEHPGIRILMFGECIKKFWKLMRGTVVALITPTLAESNDDKITLKLTNCAQVLEIGSCPDFSHCKAFKKDGSGQCSNVVNLMQSELCAYHIRQAARKLTAGRGCLVSSYIGSIKKAKEMRRGVTTVPELATKVSTNTLTIDNRRKVSQEMIKECEKKHLMQLKAAMCSPKGGSWSKRDLVDEKLSKEKKESNESFKTFLQQQQKNKCRVQTAPFLGKGLNSASVLLPSPQKTFSRLNILENAKKRAIEIVKKNGGIEKADPNSVGTRPRKRPLFQHGKENMNEQKYVNKNEVKSCENDEICSKVTNYTDQKIAALLKKKSIHEGDLHREDTARELAYFKSMEEREKLETYLTTTLEVKDCNVITCTECNYTSMKQSDFCKLMGHAVKRHKANKRFFKCRQCQRRTVSYKPTPPNRCTLCGDNNFKRVPMRDERKVTLPQENLLLRGEERKYVNC